MNERAGVVAREAERLVRLARVEAEQVGIPPERYDAGLSVVDAERLLAALAERDAEVERLRLALSEPVAVSLWDVEPAKPRTRPGFVGRRDVAAPGVNPHNQPGVCSACFGKDPECLSCWGSGKGLAPVSGSQDQEDQGGANGG